MNRSAVREAANVLSPAEQQLLNDWLDRLATARSHATGGLQPAHLDRGRVRDRAWAWLYKR